MIYKLIGKSMTFRGQLQMYRIN